MMPQVQDSDYLSTHIYSRLILPIALPLQLPGRNRHHRSGRASAFAMPFFLSHSMAFSMSQSHSARAFLASRIPAPADVGTNGYKWHKPSLNAKAEIPHTFCKESAKNLGCLSEAAVLKTCWPDSDCTFWQTSLGTSTSVTSDRCCLNDHAALSLGQLSPGHLTHLDTTLGSWLGSNKWSAWHCLVNALENIQGRSWHLGSQLWPPFSLPSFPLSFPEI